MAEKLTALEIDALTGEAIERELTPEEIAEIEQDYLKYELAKQARESAKASALAKLAALGLTEEEIAAL
jgi:16S rRNA A1518/A1519 N6-dimethyltransferase RsmA/KsgA/DIM1 with predicted DNA glycosylase/AP lyase activity